MAMNWTDEQQRVIDLRDKNILVSAAAGSGKTAVLVERILTLITDEKNPKDIDSLLIVTFTKAAAAEMRERIRAAIEKRLEEEPDNEHLQKQSTLIYNAQINTIDGFCSYLIRNYFHLIDLDPGFRTANDGELRLLKNDVLRDVIEEAYARGEEDFLELVESYATGKNDESVSRLVLQLYEYSMSYPWPALWLEECKTNYTITSVEEMKETPWMQALKQETDKILEDAMVMVEELIQVCRLDDGPSFYEEALESDRLLVEQLCQTQDYDERVQLLSQLKFARLSGKKDENASDVAKNQVKEGRQEVKDALKDLKDAWYFMSTDNMLKSILHSRVPVCALIDLTMEFTRAFSEKKREKNLIDFSDMEHYALEILTQKQEDGQVVPSSAALELSRQFSDIFIDEYQDSNLVQETILNAVSRLNRGEYNIFMVGDVKQSIYRFRLARPELFMEKFHDYAVEENEHTERIDLHKNFRSRDQILAGVNYIFRQIMGEDLGKVEYDEAAALYPGAIFPEGNEESFASTEVLLVEKDAPELADEGSRTDREIEALAVAERIRGIVGNSTVLDKESGQYRPAEYRDIVILLRTMSGWAEVFNQVLMSQGIPVYTASQTGYFSAQEVVTVLSYLHILDNPRQDIPLAAVLRSPMGGFTSEELGQIRGEDKTGDFYHSLMEYMDKGEDDKLQVRLKNFFALYEKLRRKISYTSIHELISDILQDTGYGSFAAAMPGGEQREANLHMLVEKAMEFEQTSYRGLFNFIRYIEQLHKYDVDFGEVNLSGGENVVQIMSIHKSKGLEFPIVFVSGLGKPFNRQDVNAALVIHPEFGIGADCIFSRERFKFPTAMKQEIRHAVKVENMGEELRVLYVAMTRAKEKLILTGAVSKLEDLVLKCQRLTRRSQERLPYSLREKASNYLAWILPALARHRSFAKLYDAWGLTWNGLHPLFLQTVPVDIRVITPLELIEAQIEKQTAGKMDKDRFLHWDADQVYNDEFRQKIRQQFSFQYPYENRKDIPVKVTVSEVKKQGYTQEETESFEVYFEPDVIPLVPDFVEKKEEGYTGAARGTAYHRVMECLDFVAGEDEAQVRGQLQALADSQKIDEETRETVSPGDIVTFLQSSVGMRMSHAQSCGRLRREQPFVISHTAGDIRSAWGDEETVLVQGIIDACFEEDGQWVVVDYKTDRVTRPQELVEHYHIQLDYYAQALERLTGKPVKEKIIYSFTLGREITL